MNRNAIYRYLEAFEKKSTKNWSLAWYRDLNGGYWVGTGEMMFRSGPGYIDRREPELEPDQLYLDMNPGTPRSPKSPSFTKFFDPIIPAYTYNKSDLRTDKEVILLPFAVETPILWVSKTMITLFDKDCLFEGYPVEGHAFRWGVRIFEKGEMVGILVPLLMPESQDIRQQAKLIASAEYY